MSEIIGLVIMMPIIIWSLLQGPLYTNADMVEESLHLAVYEGQKDASLKGRYDEEIYKEMRDYLVETHHYDSSKIKIKGTETLTERGGKLTVRVEVPRPPRTVIEMFKVDDTTPMVVEKTIMSEYHE